MATVTVNPGTRKLLAFAFVTAVVAFSVDKGAQWANSAMVAQPLDQLILRDDLPYLPGVLAVVAIGWLFRKSSRPQLAGIITAGLTASIIGLAIDGQMFAGWGASPIWQVIGYQVSFLFVPTLLAVLIGGFVAARVGTAAS